MFKRDWENATATVIDTRHFNSVAPHQAGMPLYSDLVLEVHPGNGTPFRSRVEVKIANALDEMRFFIPPRVGDTLNVSFDPQRSKVKVHMDPAHDRRERDRVGEDRMAQALNAAAGQTGAVVRPAAGSVEAQLAAAGVDVAALARAGIDPATLAGATVVSDGRTVQIGGQGPPTAVPSEAFSRPAVGVPAGVQAVSAADILRTGTPGTASLLGTMLAGGPSPKPGTTLFTLSLLVSLPGQAPYQVQSVYAVPDGKVSRLAPNAQLPVAASAQNPMMLAVDWDALF